MKDAEEFKRGSGALDIGLELLNSLVPHIKTNLRISDERGTIGYVLSDGSYFVAKGSVLKEGNIVSVDKELIYRKARARDARIVMFVHTGNSYTFYEIAPASLIRNGWDDMRGGRITRNFSLKIAKKIKFK